MKKTKFGTLSEGKEVYEYTLRNANGMIIKVINYGGIITSLFAPDKFGRLGDVVLGFDSLNKYINDDCYMGAIVGRYANRIANGKFSLDGREYQLAKNNNENNLHGGKMGFNKVFWEIDPIFSEYGEAIQLSYLSKDEEEGFPGNVKTIVIYTLTQDNSLIIDYTAKTDKKTIINLTQHSYFNLSAGKKKDILTHQLQIFATSYLPTDVSQIPIGSIEKVVGTPLDFSVSKQIGQDIDQKNNQLIIGAGFDQTWVINKQSNNFFNHVTHAARLMEPESGRSLDIYTTEPGIQFYSGNYLNGDETGKNGEIYGHRYGLALETQHFPNSPNEPSFPSVLLNVGEVYSSKSVYVFGQIN